MLMSGERVRLFVALQLPEPALDALVEWRTAVLRAIHALRPVARESLHVTLCFLGWHEADQVEPISAAVSGIALPPSLRLAVGRGAWLPPRRPRLIAVDLADPEGAVGEAQARLSERLVSGGWYEPERRPFRPHVTLARVGRRERLRASELPPPPPLEFEAVGVTLYRSHLSRGGSRYEALASAGRTGPP